MVGVFSKRLREMSQEELAAYLDGPGSASKLLEFQRRQAVAQIEAADAQKRAANALIDTARYTLWAVVAASVSVIVAAAGVVITLIVR